MIDHFFCVVSEYVRQRRNFARRPRPGALDLGSSGCCKCSRSLCHVLLHGCLHTCVATSSRRHYSGSLFAVTPESTLADVTRHLFSDEAVAYVDPRFIMRTVAEMELSSAAMWMWESMIFFTKDAPEDMGVTVKKEVERILHSASEVPAAGKVLYCSDYC